MSTQGVNLPCRGQRWAPMTNSICVHTRLPPYVDKEQGDQIGRIFAQLVIVNFGRLL
jgi:hypothetical protein